MDIKTSVARGKSFLREFAAYLKGDDDAAKGEKVYRQMLTSIRLQMNLREAGLVTAEQEIEDAEQKLRGARFNKGELLSDADIKDGKYVERLFAARAALEEAIDKKDKLENELDVLNKELEWLERNDPQTPVPNA